MRLSRLQVILLIGDAAALALVTVYGLAMHDMLSSAGTAIWRTFVPWLAAWVLVGWYVGVYEVEESGLWPVLGRPLWAMVLASPVAGFLRAALLGRDVVVVFVVIFGGISALTVTAWRGLFWLFVRRRAIHG